MSMQPCWISLHLFWLDRPNKLTMFFFYNNVFKNTIREAAIKLSSRDSQKKSCCAEKHLSKSSIVFPAFHKHHNSITLSISARAHIKSWNNCSLLTVTLRLLQCVNSNPNTCKLNLSLFVNNEKNNNIKLAVMDTLKYMRRHKHTHINTHTALISLPKRKDDEACHHKHYGKQNKKALTGFLPFGIVE